MSRHHTDPPEDLERMDSDELLTTIRNTSMQMSIDIITKVTTPDETRQARELRERVVNSAWILYRNLMGELDEALTQLGIRMTPQLFFRIRNIADFLIVLRIIIRNSAIKSQFRK